MESGQINQSELELLSFCAYSFKSENVKAIYLAVVQIAVLLPS